MAKTASRAYFPQLSPSRPRQQPSLAPKSITFHSRMDCTSNASSRSKSERADSYEPAQSRCRRLIGPIILNPYRRCTRNSSGLKSDGTALRSDSCTDSKNLQGGKTSVQAKPSPQPQKEAEEAEQRPKSTASAQFKIWLRKHMEKKGQHEANIKKQDTPNEVKKKEFIARVTRKGIFKYRGDHDILDCKQLETETFFCCQESSILRTQEEGGLVSANSLLSLIGP